MKPPVVLKNLIQHSAAPAMIMRAAIVGANFGVMIGLAAWLGIAAYGALIVNWAMAMVFAAIIGCGGPLVLLRRLSDGGGTSRGALICYVLIYPLMVAGLCICALPYIMPSVPWLIVLALAFVINLSACLASIMRALGSVQWSMALRDAGPFLALGLAACVTQERILPVAIVVLGGLCTVALIWILRQRRLLSMISPSGQRANVPWDMWGTSVLGMGMAQVDIVVGGAVLSDAQIGIYALLRRVTNLVALPVSVATWVTSVPISAAHGCGNYAALEMNCRKASRIALIPGLVISVAMIGVVLIQAVTGFRLWPATADLVFWLLLIGAMVQVCFAATITVATLCGLAHVTALSRLVTIGVYLMLMAGIPVLSPISNAIIYVLAVSLGSIGLWVVVRQRLQVDTSAVSLWRKEAGGVWKPS